MGRRFTKENLAARIRHLETSEIHQVGAGRPRHYAAEGTQYWNVTDDELWINHDGENGWTLCCPCVAEVISEGGLCLNKIMRIQADRDCVEEYDPTDAGFNTALSEAEDGDLIWLPAGHIDVTSDKVVPDGVTVTGAGMESTALMIPDGTTFPDANLIVLGRRCELKDLTIDGNSDNVTSDPVLIYASEESTITIQNVVCNNGGAEYISLDDCAQVVISGCKLFNWSNSNAIEIVNTAAASVSGRHIRIVNCTFINSNDVDVHAIHLEGEEEDDDSALALVIIEANTYYGPEPAIWGADGTFVYADTVDELTIDGNSFWGGNTFAYMEQCYTVAVTGNTVNHAYFGVDWLGDDGDEDRGRYLAVTGNAFFNIISSMID